MAMQEGHRRWIFAVAKAMDEYFAEHPEVERTFAAEDDLVKFIKVVKPVTP